MPRLAIFNMMFGFLVLSAVAAAGAFLATEITDGFLKDKAILDSWGLMISESAHAHTNLFAIIHVVFGLTYPYSYWKESIKKLQTIGLCAGTFAMGPLMLIKASVGAQSQTDPASVAIGICLSLALIAMASHGAGIGYKLVRRE